MDSDLYLYLVRHGQSEANIGDIFQGPDSPLTELGTRQAVFVAERMRAMHADVILTSPMLRASSTAEKIHEATRVPLEVCQLLREYVPPTRLIGTSHGAEEGSMYIKQMLAHMDDPVWHFADEDNYHDLHARARAFLAFVIQREERRIVGVTHAGFMRVLLTAMMTEGEPHPDLARTFMRFLKPMNTGISIFRYRASATKRNKWRMLAWNDHAHLGETMMPIPK